jgi:hypothetical protein
MAEERRVLYKITIVVEVKRNPGKINMTLLQKKADSKSTYI